MSHHPESVLPAAAARQTHAPSTGRPVASRVQILTPAASDDFFVTTFEGPMVGADGAAVACGGAARKSHPVRACRMELPVRTSACLTANLHLRFASSDDVHVAVVIGTETVDTFSVRAAGGVTLHRAIVPVTRWTEGTRDATITIDFDFGTRDGVVYVFESGPDCAPALEQKAEPRYVLQATGFFLGACILVPALTLTLAGLFSRVQTSYRALGTAVVAVTALYYLLGGPDLPGIALRKRVRRLFGMTRGFRIAAVLLLWAVTLPLAWYAAGIVGTLHRRHSYTRAVESALLGGDPRDAFVRLPWRRESQLLIERHAYGFRSGDNAALRVYLRKLMADPAFEAAALRPLAAFERDLRRSSGVTSDPVNWYVSLLLESGLSDARPRSLKILEGRTSGEAAIQRALIQLNMTRDERTQQAVAANLERVVDNRSEARLKQSFLYQMACDALGARHIARARWLTEACHTPCTDSERIAIRTELERAVARFRLVLRARTEAIQSDQPRWLRPPQKLYTYHLVHATPEENREGADAATSLAVNYDWCACKATTNCGRDQLRNALRPHELDAPSKWLAGTVFDAKILQDLPTTLNEGWRY